MQFSPLLNESQSGLWTALEDPYHFPSHIQDEEDTEPRKHLRRRHAEETRT